MSSPADLRPALEWGRLRVVPICHYQMEYAAWTRFEIERYRPEAIAVELPSTLHKPILTAVRRLPYPSVVLYPDARGGAVYVPVEPCDAACEALRCGLERALPVHLVDLDVDDYPLYPEPMPDPYAVRRLGLARIWEAYRAHARPQPDPSPLDAQREQHMAYWLGRLLESHERVLFVCGMAHVEPVLARIEGARIRPAGRVHRRGARLFNLHPDSAREVMQENPFVTTVYERWRSGAQPLPPRTDEEELDEPGENPPRLRLVGPVAPQRPPKQPAAPGPGGPTADRAPGAGPLEPPGGIEAGLMELLRRLFDTAGSPLKRGAAVYLSSDSARALSSSKAPVPSEDSKEPEAPSPPLKAGARPVLRLVPVAGPRPPASAKPALGAPPDFSEHDRLLPGPLGEVTAPCFPDRQDLLIGLLRAARARYRKNTRETVQPWQLRTLTRFLRRYAIAEARLLPDFFQTLAGARSCVDDNFAHEVWELGRDYPFVDRTGKLETIRVKGEEIWLGVRRIRFRCRFPDRSRREESLPMRARKREARPGEWREKFRAGGICSYPPEDLTLEDFGRFLKTKAGKMLSEERSRVEPFTTSLRDGVDLRETTRNWHDGQKLYVREAGRVTGGVGAVVVVFDEDRKGDRFPWCVTWWGEHEQESDLAYYSTAATGQIVGPGIARCHYGGFLMTHPPGRLYDVWTDGFYAAAESKPERMLMAAVDYSLEKHVVYVAPRPPRGRIVSWARRLGKKVVFVPIGCLSPVTLKKLRVFHVLSDQAVRQIAKEYVT